LRDRPSYRPDIDGLRTVAVISVLLFHIDFSWMPGGYTGVDVFFVISGFLITQIISRDIEHGAFSLGGFYVRRIRRILPVFYTVAIVTLILGIILLLPDDLYALLSSIRYAVMFAANRYFSASQGYFDISADEKPMLHIWSLSIEEQYYFVWPLLLFVLYRIVNELFKNNEQLGRRVALTFISSLTMVGFLLAQRALVENLGVTELYFSFQARFGELMIGSLVALLPLYRNEALLRILTYAGGVLILVGIFLLDKDSIFPGYNALLPCLGAAFIIYAGQGTKGQVTWLHRALSRPVMVRVGLLSYSLYLWHWPVLAYLRYVYGSYTLPWNWALMAMAATFILSFLSYRYIECKTKKAALGFRKAFLIVFLFPAFLIIGFTYIVPQIRPSASYEVEFRSYGPDVCHGNFDKQCVRGDTSKPPTILMTGDSHAAMLNSFIDVVGRHERWSAEIVTASSCSPVFGLDETVLPRWAHKPCSDLKDFVAQNYRNYDAVFLASLWAFQLGMQDTRADVKYLEKLEATLRQMARHVPVYVFSDIPQLVVHPFRQQHFSKLGLKVNRKPSDESSRANAIVKHLVEQVPNAHWVDLSSASAGFEHMSAYAGRPTYFDENHLNIYGAATLGRLFVESGNHVLPNQ